jgi:CheY-like chemotaxis protein
MPIATLLSLALPGFILAQANPAQQQNFAGGFGFYLIILIASLLVLLAALYYQHEKGKKLSRILEEENDKNRQLESALEEEQHAMAHKTEEVEQLNKKLSDAQAENEGIEKRTLAANNFLATMSQKMRAPLNVIITLSHALIDEIEEEGIVERLRKMQYSTNDLLVYINDVLKFSKIEAGKLCLDEYEFQPAVLFEDVFADFEKVISEKDLVLNYQQSPKVPEKLLGNGVQLRQVVSCLLAVAAEHAQRGAIRVAISPDQLFTRDAVLKITINYSDSGTGLQLFESLSRKAQMQVSQEDSSGSNDLPVIKRLIELQNGSLEVELRAEDSTIITVYLPFKIPGGVVSATREGVRHSLADKKVLVVEDNKINQLVVANALRSNGAEVVTSDNGKEALEAFDDQYFDLVLMDIQMPVMDGYQATAAMRRHKDVRKRDVPIIALTASAVLTEKEKANLFGMNDRLGKPFALEELIEKICATLELHANVFHE